MVSWLQGRNIMVEGCVGEILLTDRTRKQREETAPEEKGPKTRYSAQGYTSVTHPYRP